MDFDLTKENIQPLRGGRNVTQLGIALQAQSNREYQRELIQQKEEFENAIRNYIGEDPLDNWYHYISWIEQSYPKHGHEGNLVSLLEHCLGKFENEKRYTNDRRFCKLWIKYIDLQQNPLELYQMMYARGLCRGCADLYRAWAYYHEAAEDFQNANLVFENGKRELAQPYEELEIAHNNLFMSAGQHVLLGKDERRLQEKRQALTSLHTYKPGKVASIRTVAGDAGVLHVASGHSSGKFNNASVPIYEDESHARGAGVAPSSILSVARRHDAPKENTLKPGPWTTVPVKKRHTTTSKTPAFTVYSEDSPNVSANHSINGLNLPPGSFPKTSLEDYSTWHVNLTIAEPVDLHVRPMYPKAKVYSEAHTEFSIEEIRSARYLKPMEIHAVHEPHVLENQNIPHSSLYNPIQPFQSPLHNEVSYHDQPSAQAHHYMNNTLQNLPQIEQHPIHNPNMSEHHSLLNSYQPIPQIQQVQQHNYTYNDSLRLQCDNTPPVTHMTPLWVQSQPQPMVIPDSNPVEPQQNFHASNFDIWNMTTADEELIRVKPQAETSKFSIYEQSNFIQDQVQPKGSAMKTPFKVLTADELAETGSRGGMDVAAAAQPVDGARRLLMALPDDSSNSSFEEIHFPNPAHDLSAPCDTQMFNFNLNAMQVSTPQQKQVEQNLQRQMNGTTKKQLFTETTIEPKKNENLLSPILEETRSYVSSSSSGRTTKSSIYNSHTKHTNMGAISEEHNSYLAQNLMANAALRSSLLGDLMDFDTRPAPQPMQDSPVPSQPASPVRTIPAPTPTRPLEHVPSDPFRHDVIRVLLERVSFPGVHTYGHNELLSMPKLKVSKEVVQIGNDNYIVEKQLGKGTFGTVFKAQALRSGQTVALKYQKPANCWEFYICREIQARLVNHPLLDRFMDVTLGYFSDQASILISDYVRFGSLLDLVNTVKQKSGKPLKESLCVYFCLEMLRIVEALHQIKIIHADIKPDNFLIKLQGDSVTLELIDFGCSIDMSLFPAGASFARKINTENFICCEMRDGRPWNYHTDMFCIAATAHVLLFDKYIDLKKKDGHWSITHRMPRYIRMDLWNMFFSSLLNQQSGPAESKPLQAMLEEALNQLDDFLGEMRFIINILRNR